MDTTQAIGRLSVNASHFAYTAYGGYKRRLSPETPPAAAPTQGSDRPDLYQFPACRI